MEDSSSSRDESSLQRSEAEDVDYSDCNTQEGASPGATSQLPYSSASSSSPPLPTDCIRKSNIRLILIYTWIVFAGRSIWNQNVLATFCFLLCDKDPKSVGYLTAAMGICQLVVSFPVGYLADKYRRDHLLKLASFMGMVAAGTTLKVLFWNGHDHDHHHQPTYGGLILALCLWGCFWGIANTCLTAVFADSIANGERSKYFTQRSILINLGNLSGPTVALTMFFILGNEWTLMDCAYVMGTGQLICLPAMVLLCFVKDPQWQDQQESLHGRDCDLVDTNRDQENSLRIPLLSETDAEVDDESSAQVGSGRQAIDNAAAAPEIRPHRDETYDATKLAKILGCLCCCLNSDEPPKRIIPSLVASADVLSGLASGMSIRYFAIFLYDNLHLKPVHVQVLYMIAPIVQACLTKLAQVLAKSYGRCRVTVAFKWIGVSFMMAMVTMTKFSKQSIDDGNKQVIAMICALMVTRTAFMNATSALTKSVLMDHVPNNERAKWSALESFSMFSWSGSAALGGILVSYHGILFNFCITASLQFVATWPHLLLARAAVSSNENENQNEHLEANQPEVDRRRDRSNTDGQERVEAINSV